MNEDMDETGSSGAVVQQQTANLSGGERPPAAASQAQEVEAAEPASVESAAEPLAANPVQGGGTEMQQSAQSQVQANAGTAQAVSSTLTDDYDQWLNAKLKASKDWLSQADSKKVSIQVLMRRKSAARELVYYLRNEWPLDLSKTYLYEVNIENRPIYRVFYSEYDSLAHGRQQLEKLPETVKVNSPYLHSVSRMQKALL